MNRGLSFDIPNGYGHFLGDILKPMEVAAFKWKIGDGESYKLVNDHLNEGLFSEEPALLEGSELKALIENSIYYVISADLQAFPNRETNTIETYEGFLASDCALVLLVIDSSYVIIYCKDQQLIGLLHKNAMDQGYQNIEYLTDENDSRTRLSVW